MIEIHSEGWDEVEESIIRLAEEDIAQQLAHQAIADGAESPTTLNIDLSALPDSYSHDRVADRVREIVAEELGR